VLTGVDATAATDEVDGGVGDGYDGLCAGGMDG
jgi:hypothetical protein